MRQHHVYRLRTEPMTDTLTRSTRLLLLPACIALMASACHPGEPSPAPTDPVAGEAAAGTPGEAIIESRFRCGELLVAIDDVPAVDHIRLRFSGQSLTLPAAIAASGARYADDQGNVFWNKGDEATLSLAGQEDRECTATTDISPWEAAAARGVHFRAIGQEPGWLAELDAPPQSSLRLQLDYGQALVEVPNAEALPGADGATRYTGQTLQDVEVELRVSERPCEDAMSGERFAYTAELEVDGRQYAGCGAYLESGDD